MSIEAIDHVPLGRGQSFNCARTFLEGGDDSGRTDVERAEYEAFEAWLEKASGYRKPASVTTFIPVSRNLL